MIVSARPPPFQFQLIARCIPYGDKLLHYFEGISFACFGTYELSRSVNRSWPEKYQEADRIFKLVRGILLTASGGAALACAAHEFGHLSLQQLYPCLFAVKDWGFSLANLYMLWHFMKVYAKASEEGNQKIKTSALFGICSSLGYLFAMAAAALGTSSAIIFLFVCLGVGSGGIKWLLDYVN